MIEETWLLFSLRAFLGFCLFSEGTPSSPPLGSSSFLMLCLSYLCKWYTAPKVLPLGGTVL